MGALLGCVRVEYEYVHCAQYSCVLHSLLYSGQSISDKLASKAVPAHDALNHLLERLLGK